MRAHIWGTRGSMPAGLTHASRYGSNTSCIEVILSYGARIILDAGTGLYPLSQRLLGTAPTPWTICFSHYHWDHIQGLPHCAQLYDPNWNIRFAGVRSESGPCLQDKISALFDGCHFPVTWDRLQAQKTFTEIGEQESFTVNEATVSVCPTCHPGGNHAWRIDADGNSLVYTGDHEWGLNAITDARLIEFFTGADILIVDAHFLPSEYPSHRNWGHSCTESWPDAAAFAGVGHLLFTHHAPEHTDRILQKALEDTQKRYAHHFLPMDLASEGMEIIAGSKKMAIAHQAYVVGDCPLCDLASEVAMLSDTNVILDKLLAEARKIGHADAGTIYLVEGDMLVFAHTQNDTLFPGSAAARHNYLNARIPISPHSIAGYVASTSQSLNIADVRELPEDLPFSFNRAFDNANGYRTVSMLTVPIVNRLGKVIGVMQVINSMQDGIKSPFTQRMEESIERLAVQSSIYIERGIMTHELIMRMFRTSALRDDSETTGHVQRVSSLSAELYRAWAEKHDFAEDDIRCKQGNIKLASILHDVGKVGIPDAVLHKNGRLNDEEFEIIKKHTAYGAELFDTFTGELDEMAHNISQHHHQKWDGSGYTGSPDVPRLKGTDIPIEARIVAVADVYDALVSRRCYKEGWTPEAAREQLRTDAGSHLDPELVDIFLGMNDIVSAIYARFP